ncbi:MAG: hypothetical protein K8I27_05670 [Planctomycetes bacterium]|nr:hypothetical protein [Planctomycetota bacterium]
MRTVVRFVVLVGIFGVVFHGPTQSAQTPQEPNADILDILGEEQAELMKLDSWPDETDAILGFTFEQAAYGVLNGYEQLEDGVTVFRETKTLSDGGGSIPSWDEESGTYRFVWLESWCLEVRTTELASKSWLRRTTTPPSESWRWMSPGNGRCPSGRLIRFGVLTLA